MDIATQRKKETNERRQLVKTRPARSCDEDAVNKSDADGEERPQIRSDAEGDHIFERSEN